MAQPIYKVFMARYTEAWHQRSKEEQDDLFAKNMKAFERLGGKFVLVCDSLWASDQWHFWGVAEFPDLESIQKYTEAMVELNWFRYVEGISVLGTVWPTS